MDFMDRVKHFPEDLLLEKSSTRRRIDSNESDEYSPNSSEERKEILDPEEEILVAEKRLADLMQHLQQSNEKPD